MYKYQIFSVKKLEKENINIRYELMRIYNFAN